MSLSMRSFRDCDGDGQKGERGRSGLGEHAGIIPLSIPYACTCCGSTIILVAISCRFRCCCCPSNTLHVVSRAPPQKRSRGGFFRRWFQTREPALKPPSLFTVHTHNHTHPSPLNSRNFTQPSSGDSFRNKPIGSCYPNVDTWFPRANIMRSPAECCCLPNIVCGVRACMRERLRVSFTLRADSANRLEKSNAEESQRLKMHAGGWEGLCARAPVASHHRWLSCRPGSS